MAASSSKMLQIAPKWLLQIPWKTRGSSSKILQMPLKWQLPAPKCCKYQGPGNQKKTNNSGPVKHRQATLDMLFLAIFFSQSHNDHNKPASAIWIPEIFCLFCCCVLSTDQIILASTCFIYRFRFDGKDMHRRVSITTAKQEDEINNTQTAQYTEVCWITSLVPGPISSPNRSAFTLPKQPKSWTQIGIQRLQRCVAGHPTNSGSTAAPPFARKSHIRFCISLWILHFLHATRSLACE